MHTLAGTVYVFTSQGIPFMHAGMEMLRTKFGEENSFESPDSDQSDRLDPRKGIYPEVYFYYKGLIALTKGTPRISNDNSRGFAS